MLSDGGRFVVQELPLTGIDVHWDAFGPGTATLSLHADLIEFKDSE